MKKKFSGLIVPALTVVDAQGALDEAGYRKHLADLIARGVNGLYVTGTTGEAGQLPYETWKAANRTALEVAKGTATRVYSGAVAPGTLETIDRIHVLEEMGAETVFATPMFYITGYTQQQIYLHYEKICRATPLEVVIYNILFTTHVDIHTDTLARIIGLDNIIGIKDTRLDWGTHMNNLRLLKDTKVGIACVPEPFIAASLLMGADGIVTALANFLPELYLEAIAAADTQDKERLMRAFDEIMAFDAVLHCPTGNGMTGFKYLLSLLNGTSPHMVLTTEPITPEQREVYAKAADYIRSKRAAF